MNCVDISMNWQEGIWEQIWHTTPEDININYAFESSCYYTSSKEKGDYYCAPTKERRGWLAVLPCRDSKTLPFHSGI